MSSTLLYQLALFGHILAAFGLIATITVEAVSLRGLRQAATSEAAHLSLRAMQFVPPLGGSSTALILVTGIYMMATSWGVQGWIVIAFAGLVVIALLGALVTRNRMTRVGPVLATTGPLSRQARASLRDPVLLASLRLRLGILIGILFLMTVKPSAWISLTAIVLAAVIGLASARIPARRFANELRAQNG